MQRPVPDPSRTRRRGIGLAEVLVIVLVIGCLALLLSMGLVRSREAARSATCSRNLQQLGIALGMYEQSSGRLPAVPKPVGLDATGPGPIALMMMQLGATDLGALDPRATPPPPALEGPPAESYRPGLVCPSDPIATSRVFPAPLNYRANAGIGTDGRLGPFSPGASTTLAEVEAGHGASYTAAFAERLVGSAGAANERSRDYAIVPGPIPASGCPDLPGATLQTDAGRSWREAGWRSALETHAAPPSARDACIAGDGETAFMGASSGHVDGVRVLLMDGGVRTYGRTVSPAVWEALGSVRDPGPSGDAAGPPAIGPVGSAQPPR